MKNLNNSVFGSIALLILFLALWQWGPGLLGMPEFVMPKLSRVAQEGVLMWQTGGLLQHTLITAFEIVVGFALGALRRPAVHDTADVGLVITARPSIVAGPPPRSAPR